MSYKEFEDFYREADIKHLPLFEHNGYLIAPPFCTDQCKEYSKIMLYKDGELNFIDVNTPPATSKYNAMAVVDNSLFFVPYGIWDEFNTVLELRDFQPYYHELESTGKGQFYNLASDGKTAFSAPLGYDPVSFCIFIKDRKVKQIPVDLNQSLKCHMGVVHSNGCYYSPPRGEDPDYNYILKFNPTQQELTKIAVEGLPKACRKYSDFIQAGNKLYALPFGHAGHLSEILVLNTETDTTELVKLNIPDFYKKYNTGVLVDNKIIALPYGHKDSEVSNHGLVFDIDTYEYFTFDIGLKFGGKYRFRSGIEFNGNALYLPCGTPSIDIMAVNTKGEIVFRKSMKEYVIGRPVIYKDKVCSIAYKISSKEHMLLTVNKDFTVNLDLLF